MYFDDFLTRLKKNDLPRVLLLFGDSDGVLAEGLLNIREKFRQTSPDGDQKIFDGQESSLGDILMASQTSSLFASSQLLVMQHGEKILGGHSVAALGSLKDYFSNESLLHAKSVLRIALGESFQSAAPEPMARQPSASFT